MFAIGETVYFLQMYIPIKVVVFEGVIADIKEDGTYEISTKLDNTDPNFATWRKRTRVYPTAHAAENALYRYINEGNLL